jgi:hypothetical protein
MFNILNRKKKVQSTPQTTINDPIGGSNNFGYSMGISGDGNTLVIGAPYRNTAIVDEGYVAVFNRTGKTWTQFQLITRVGVVSTDLFGINVAISNDGSTICASNGTNPGIVTIYTLSGGAWSVQTTLTGASGQTNNQFGSALSFSDDGNTLAIGEHLRNSTYTGQGRVLIYTRAGTTWSLQSTLTHSLAGAQHFFGRSVSLSSSGDKLIVGSPQYGGSSVAYGCSVIFTRSGTTWTEQQTLFQNSPSMLDRAGFSVVISKDGLMAAMCVPFKTSGSAQGCIAVYTFSGGVWSLQQQVFASIGTSTDQLGVGFSNGIGFSLSKNNSLMVVGARGYNTNSGRAYVFEKNTNTWSYKNELLRTSGAQTHDYFGGAVCMSDYGSVVVVGAPWDDVGSTDEGSATIFYRR